MWSTLKWNWATVSTVKLKQAFIHLQKSLFYWTWNTLHIHIAVLNLQNHSCSALSLSVVTLYQLRALCSFLLAHLGQTVSHLSTPVGVPAREMQATAPPSALITTRFHITCKCQDSERDKLACYCKIWYSVVWAQADPPLICTVCYKSTFSKPLDEVQWYVDTGYENTIIIYQYLKWVSEYSVGYEAFMIIIEAFFFFFNGKKNEQDQFSHSYEETLGNTCHRFFFFTPNSELIELFLFWQSLTESLLCDNWITPCYVWKSFVLVVPADNKDMWSH